MSLKAEKAEKQSAPAKPAAKKLADLDDDLAF
jgi:hypothetical protein